MAALHVTDATFEEEVIKSEIPVLVDFWAEWCGPCKMVGPTIEKLSEDYKGKVKIAKLDVDSNQNIAAKYSIQSIPTMMIFVKGQVVDGMMGAQPESAIKSRLDKYVN
ncbi:MAG: thioredoxin [Candidatus Delongbacteria bacterium]